MATVFTTVGLAAYNTKALSSNAIKIVRIVIEDYTTARHINARRRGDAAAGSSGPKLADADADRYEYTGTTIVDIDSTGAVVIIPLAFVDKTEAYNAWAVFIYIEGDTVGSEILFIVQADGAAAQFVKALNVDVISTISWTLGQAGPLALAVTTDVNITSLTQFPASAIISGVLDTDRLGGGTASNVTVLYGDGQWRRIVGLPASVITSGVVNPAFLGTGDTDDTVVLYGDGTWGIIASLPASAITSEVFDGARLGDGSANDSSVLYGDSQWRTMPQYWYGTQAEYDAIADKDDDVEYNIHE